MKNNGRATIGWMWRSRWQAPDMLEHFERCAGLLADYCLVTQNVCQDFPCV